MLKAPKHSLHGLDCHCLLFLALADSVHGTYGLWELGEKGEGLAVESEVASVPDGDQGLVEV